MSVFNYGFDTLSEDIIMKISNQLSCRDRYQLAKTSKLYYQWVWQSVNSKYGEVGIHAKRNPSVEKIGGKSKEGKVDIPPTYTYNALTSQSPYVATISVTGYTCMPHDLAVSKDGHLVAALCKRNAGENPNTNANTNINTSGQGQLQMPMQIQRQGSGSGHLQLSRQGSTTGTGIVSATCVMVLWHIPTMTQHHVPVVPDAEPDEVLLAVAENGTRVVMLTSRTRMLHVVNIDVVKAEETETLVEPKSKEKEEKEKEKEKEVSVKSKEKDVRIGKLESIVRALAAKSGRVSQMPSATPNLNPKVVAPLSAPKATSLKPTGSIPIAPDALSNKSSQPKYTTRIREVVEQNAKLAYIKACAISSCGKFLAVYNDQDKSISIFHISESPDHMLKRVSHWEMGNNEFHVQELKFGFKHENHSELWVLLQSDYTSSHRICAYNWSTGTYLRGVDIESTNHRVGALSASWDWIAFKELDRKLCSRGRRNIRSEVFRVPSSQEDLVAGLSPVVVSKESTKMHRYLSLQKQACAVYERERQTEPDSFGKRVTYTERALLGVVAVHNKWNFRAVPIGEEHANGNQNPQQVQQITDEDPGKLIPVSQSENALMEDHAKIRFSRNGQWAVFSRMDAASGGRIVLGLQNIMLSG